MLNLTKAAKKIGISRPTLYKYLKRFKPVEYGGRPTLTVEQVRAIKSERNGKTAT